MNFPFLNSDVHRSTSYGVHISQLIRFARVCSHVDDFNTHNKVLTSKHLKQGYTNHKLGKALPELYGQGIFPRHKIQAQKDLVEEVF